MKLKSDRFGEIEVREDRVIHLKGGLLGFSDKEKYIMLDDPDDASLPFKWLVAIEDPNLGFLVTDPGIFFKDYVFDLPEEDRAYLGVDSETGVSVLTLLTVPSDPKMITANLRGPIVINSDTLSGKQFVLNDSRYVTKHYIFIQATGSEAEAATDAADANEVNAEAYASKAAQGASANTDVGKN